MLTISNWVAKRSGAYVTINGIAANGRVVSLTGIRSITVTSDGILAEAAGEEVIRLAPDYLTPTAVLSRSLADAGEA